MEQSGEGDFSKCGESGVEIVVLILFCLWIMHMSLL